MTTPTTPPIQPAESCGRHFPIACPTGCPIKGDRFSRRQLDAQAAAYPRLPELAPRGSDETAEDYGLRAFAFVTAHNVTATVPTDALELAAHTYRIVIVNRDLLPATIDRLAAVDTAIAQALRWRAAEDRTAGAVTPIVVAAGAGRDKPNAGPMAPLSPAPIVPPPMPSAVVPSDWTAPIVAVQYKPVPTVCDNKLAFNF